MKKNIIKVLLASIVVLLASCRANMPVSQQSGKDDVGYLLFTSASNQSNFEVEVTLDNAKTFTATTVKARKANRRGTQYSVSTGRHDITVKKDGKVLYQKAIMMSSQEVKQIQLP